MPSESERNFRTVLNFLLSEICSSTLKLGNIDYCAMQTTESVDYVTSQQRCSDVNMMTIEHWSRDQVTALQATEYHQNIRYIVYCYDVLRLRIVLQIVVFIGLCEGVWGPNLKPG